MSPDSSSRLLEVGVVGPPNIIKSPLGRRIVVDDKHLVCDGDYDVGFHLCVTQIKGKNILIQMFGGGGFIL